MKIRLITLIVIVFPAFVACAPASTPAAAVGEKDPASVVKAYFEAWNADNLDAAMALVADDAVWDLPIETARGKEKIRELEQYTMQNGSELKMSDIQVTGNKVTFKANLLWRGMHIQHTEEAIVQDSKITSLTAR